MKALQTPILILALFLSVFSVSQAATKTIKKTIKAPIIQCLPDQAMIKKMADLTAQNTDLQTKNVDLQAQVDRLLKANKNLASSNTETTVNAGCLDAKEDVVKYRKEMSDLNQRYQSSFESILQNSTGAETSAVNGNIHITDQELKAKQNTIYDKMNTAQAQVQLYCK